MEHARHDIVIKYPNTTMLASTTTTFTNMENTEVIKPGKDNLEYKLISDHLPFSPSLNSLPSSKTKIGENNLSVPSKGHMGEAKVREQSSTLISNLKTDNGMVVHQLQRDCYNKTVEGSLVKPCTHIMLQKNEPAESKNTPNNEVQKYICTSERKDPKYTVDITSEPTTIVIKRCGSRVSMVESCMRFRGGGSNQQPTAIGSSQTDEHRRIKETTIPMPVRDRRHTNKFRRQLSSSSIETNSEESIAERSTTDSDNEHRTSKGPIDERYRQRTSPSGNRGNEKRTSRNFNGSYYSVPHPAGRTMTNDEFKRRFSKIYVMPNQPMYLGPGPSVIHKEGKEVSKKPGRPKRSNNKHKHGPTVYNSYSRNNLSKTQDIRNADKHLYGTSESMSKTKQSTFDGLANNHKAPISVTRENDPSAHSTFRSKSNSQYNVRNNIAQCSDWIKGSRVSSSSGNSNNHILSQTIHENVPTAQEKPCHNFTTNEFTQTERHGYSAELEKFLEQHLRTCYSCGMPTIHIIGKEYDYIVTATDDSVVNGPLEPEFSQRDMERLQIQAHSSGQRNSLPIEHSRDFASNIGDRHEDFAQSHPFPPSAEIPKQTRDVTPKQSIHTSLSKANHNSADHKRPSDYIKLTHSSDSASNYIIRTHKSYLLTRGMDVSDTEDIRPNSKYDPISEAPNGKSKEKTQFQKQPKHSLESNVQGVTIGSYVDRDSSAPVLTTPLKQYSSFSNSRYKEPTSDIRTEKIGGSLTTEQGSQTVEGTSVSSDLKLQNYGENETSSTQTGKELLDTKAKRQYLENEILSKSNDTDRSNVATIDKQDNKSNYSSKVLHSEQKIEKSLDMDKMSFSSSAQRETPGNTPIRNITTPYRPYDSRFLEGKPFQVSKASNIEKSLSNNRRPSVQRDSIPPPITKENVESEPMPQFSVVMTPEEFKKGRQEELAKLGSHSILEQQLSMRHPEAPIKEESRHLYTIHCKYCGSIFRAPCTVRRPSQVCPAALDNNSYEEHKENETLRGKPHSQTKDVSRVLWALAKVNIFKDGTRSFEILEATNIPPGHYLMPETEAYMLIPTDPPLS